MWVLDHKEGSVLKNWSFWIVVLKKTLKSPLDCKQYPQAVLWEVLWARRSKITAKWARTRAWAGWWFFLEEEEVCGCRNKWRGAIMGSRGRGAPSTLVARCLPLLLCSQCQISQIFQKKSYSIFRAFGELLFSGYFYIARINQKTDRKILFLLYFN